MATYVLIPGAGCDPWYWHPVADDLRGRGHEVVAVDLPCEDPAAGLAEYTDTVVDAIGDRTDLVVVAHSLGGFTAPLVCARIPVDLLVLLEAMIPKPGETLADWWAATGQAQARREQAERDGRTVGDLWDDFLHDVPPDLAAGLRERDREQSDGPSHQPWPLDAWPDVPTRVLIGSDDRLFPAGFMRRVARERLGITPDEIPAGHMPMLSRPAELAERLESYRTALSGE
ncbi:alpha/beta fold hydrolase [Nocardiopsis sediminis]|uniref:Alpha/beta fold hydrolase n=1 Tax=Nocardiopsis sediminis TaxID=1778267 RepID=A0ABV8FQK3_9ACTN